MLGTLVGATTERDLARLCWLWLLAVEVVVGVVLVLFVGTVLWLCGWEGEDDAADLGVEYARALAPVLPWNTWLFGGPVFLNLSKLPDLAWSS